MVHGLTEQANTMWYEFVKNHIPTTFLTWGMRREVTKSVRLDKRDDKFLKKLKKSEAKGKVANIEKWGLKEINVYKAEVKNIFALIFHSCQLLHDLNESMKEFGTTNKRLATEGAPKKIIEEFAKGTDLDKAELIKNLRNARGFLETLQAEAEKIRA